MGGDGRRLPSVLRLGIARFMNDRQVWINARRLILSAIDMLDKHFGVGKYTGTNFTPPHPGAKELTEQPSMPLPIDTQSEKV